MTDERPNVKPSVPEPGRLVDELERLSWTMGVLITELERMRVVLERLQAELQP